MLRKFTCHALVSKPRPHRDSTASLRSAKMATSKKSDKCDTHAMPGSRAPCTPFLK